MIRSFLYFLILLFLFLLVFSIIHFFLLYPLYSAKEVIISYGLTPFDICQENPQIWYYLKLFYPIVFISSYCILFYRFYSNFLYPKFISKKFVSKNVTSSSANDSSSFKLLVGNKVDTNSPVFISESGLYQNILITGTIGCGKTSSAMYPFTNQFIKYNSKHDEKVGMLILDVKGNYHEQVKSFCQQSGLEDDLIVLSLNSSTTYNPLHKPNLKPQVLANQLKTILTLFSENNSESYWLDKAEQILTECIKLCRLYNDGYVTFAEIHKLVMIPNYYQEKLDYIRNLFILGKLNQKQIYELNTALDFFQKEFEKLDSRTSSILKSEISRITMPFISDYEVSKTFCPSKGNLTFCGFHEILSKGKILVLNINIAEYKNISKIIAAYLKLDFQTEIMQNLAYSTVKPSVFICDEYAEYATKTDSDFFSLSREAKCINIISIQSYSSLKNSLKDDSSVKIILQNLVNKIWFRTDDIFTIEEIQKQLGKADKIKTSVSISENAKHSNFSYLANSFHSMDSNISESYSTYTQHEFIFDTKFFTQELQTFTSLAFLSDGNQILKPCKIKMLPYFLNNL